MLKKIGLGFGLLALAAVTTQSASAGDQDFTLVNATGYTISEVYVSPSKAKDWEEDVLGRDVLAEGESTEIRFSRSEDTCKWDLKVVYEDDNSSAEWASLDLCTISAVTIRYNRKTEETSAITQ